MIKLKAISSWLPYDHLSHPSSLRSSLDKEKGNRIVCEQPWNKSHLKAACVTAVGLETETGAKAMQINDGVKTLPEQMHSRVSIYLSRDASSLVSL